MNSDQFFFAIFGLDSVSSRLKNKDLILNEIFGGVACNEKVLAKDGLLQLKFQLKTKLSNCFFRETKLQKNVKRKSNCDKK